MTLFKSYKTNRRTCWMEKPTYTHKQTVSNTLRRHTNNHSRPEWREMCVCKYVSHNRFSPSQQKLEIFHFLLWRVWGGDGQGAGLVAKEIRSFPVESYLKSKTDAVCNIQTHEQHTLKKRGIVGAKLKPVYRVTQCYKAELSWVLIILLCSGVPCTS